MPYVVDENVLKVNGKEFIISFIRPDKIKPWLHEMELIDGEGNKHFFNQIQYGEPFVPYDTVKIPF